MPMWRIVSTLNCCCCCFDSWSAGITFELVERKVHRTKWFKVLIITCTLVCDKGRIESGVLVSFDFNKYQFLMNNQSSEAL
jgi:hypothetical protein